MNRRCGDCTLCCKLLPAPELEKPAGARCSHQRHGKGCAVYARRPWSCATWTCRWLAGDDTSDLSRPDRVHYVIDVMPDFVRVGPDSQAVPVVQVWIDPDYPDAHRDPRLRAYLARRGTRRGGRARALLVRRRSRACAAVALRRRPLARDRPGRPGRAAHNHRNHPGHSHRESRMKMTGSEVKEQPKKLTSPADREMARHMRDWQWGFMERVARQGTVWCCWWDKAGRYRDKDNPPPDDLLVCGLIGAMELLDWMGRHKDWWIVGEWSDARYAAPVSLTAAGKKALAERDRYDMEPVYGGMVEPGWQAVPLPKARAA